MKRPLSIATLIIVLSTSVSAQKEAAQWRFGQNAGLQFQGNTVSTVSTNIMPAFYSYSGISDSAGNLLFYVGSSQIVNRNNAIMTNGANINGNYTGTGSGSQESLVIRKGGSLYYVITHNNGNYFYTSPIAPMTSYAIVDMNLDSGLGAVTVTNVPISAFGLPVVGKMAATRHCNGIDHWLLRHQGGFPGTNNYLSYLVSSSGVSLNPIVSPLGSLHSQAYTQLQAFYRGVHKFSPNGRKVAATMPYRTVELYDFDNSTGILSNAIKLDSVANPPDLDGLDDPSALGLEFSPDGTKLYVTYANNHPFLCQFDLSAGSASAIAASKTVINQDTFFNSSQFFPMQLGLDGKIYVNNNYVGTYSSSIAVINNPNELGILCNYQSQAITLGNSTLPPYYVAAQGAGLPSFESHFFEQKPVLSPVTSSIICGLVNFTSPTLCAAAGYSVNTYEWNFNDPASGTNTTIAANPSHVFSANGTYSAHLVLHYHPCGTDTLKQVLTITGLPTLSVSGKSKVCKNEKTILTVTGVSNYSLNGMAANQNTVMVQPTVSTVYSITTTNTLTGCSALKIISVTVDPCTSLTHIDSQEAQITIYPNPSVDTFILETEGTSVNIRVYNQLGILIYKGVSLATKHSIDLSAHPNGMYLVELQGSDFVKTQKLIKQ